MAKLRYAKRPEGRTVSNGCLTIILLNNDLDCIRSQIVKIAETAKLQSGNEKVDPKYWESEADRLCGLAESIVSPNTSVNIFDYINLTKSGDFPKNTNQLIADTKCVAGASYQGVSNRYPVIQRLQLRLVPAFLGEMNWLGNKRMENTMCLAIRMFDSSGKQVPVFDEKGIPHKVETARTKYLSNDEILPGCVYEEKSGAQFLCVTGCRFKETNVQKGYSNDVCSPEMNWYIRYTKALDKDIESGASFNDVIRAMAAKDKSSSISKRLSCRENPRKFVKEVKVVFDPVHTKPETILGAAHKSPYYADEIDQYEYEIL